MRKIRFVDILRTDVKLQEKVRQWRNKKEIRRFMQNQHIIGKKEHHGWLEGLRNGNDAKFWVVFFGRAPIGTVNLAYIDYKKLTTEWGFYIGDDEYKGRGLSKIILFKLLKIVFDKMKFMTLMTSVLSNNTIALALYKKFRFKETAKSPFKAKVDNILFKFSKQDWRRFKEDLKNECCKKR